MSVGQNWASIFSPLESSRIASILEPPRPAAGERDVATLAMRQLLLGRLRTAEANIDGPAPGTKQNNTEQRANLRPAKSRVTTTRRNASEERVPSLAYYILWFSA